MVENRSQHGVIQHEIDEPGEKVGLLPRFLNYLVFLLRNITIEPVVFFHAVGFNVARVLNASLMLDKICQVGTTWFSNGTHFSAETCDALDNGEHEDIQNFVQSSYSKVSAASSYFGQVPALIMVIVMGDLADKKGRKIVLFLTLLNQLIDNLFYLIQSVFFMEISANYFLFENIGNIFGSSNVFYMAVYAYAADISSSKNRLGRLLIMDVSYSITTTAISGSTGYIFKTIGYVGAYGVSVVSTILGMVYLVLFIKESKKFDEVDDQPSFVDNDRKSDPIAKVGILDKIRNLALQICLPFIDSINVLWKKRSHGLRHIIILYIVLFALKVLGDGTYNDNIEIAYQKKTFPWESVVEYNIFHSKLISVTYFFRTFVLIFTPVLVGSTSMLKDCVVNIFAMSSTFASRVLYLVAWDPVAFYIAEVVGVLLCLSNNSFRSHLSKLLPSGDAGKMFSIIALLQSISNGFATGAWFMFYNATLDFHPGYIYCLASTTILVIIMGLFYIHFYTRRVERLEKMEEIRKPSDVVQTTRL